MKSSNCANQLPQPASAVAPGYVSQFADGESRQAPSGADRWMTAVWQRVKCSYGAHPIQFGWIDAPFFFITPPFCLHLPALYNQPALNHTTNCCDCELADSNLASFPLFPLLLGERAEYGTTR